MKDGNGTRLEKRRGVFRVAIAVIRWLLAFPPCAVVAASLAYSLVEWVVFSQTVSPLDAVSGFMDPTWPLGLYELAVVPVVVLAAIYLCVPRFKWGVTFIVGYATLTAAVFYYPASVFSPLYFGLQDVSRPLFILLESILFTLILLWMPLRNGGLPGGGRNPGTFEH